LRADIVSIATLVVGVVTGQFADKPTCGPSRRRLVNSRTSQLADTFDLKFTVNNCYKSDFR